MVSAKETREAAEGQKSHVLTEQEAIVLLLTSDGYLRSHTDHVNDRHRTEVVAEAMERAGHFDLASEAIVIHKVLQSFGKGDFKALQYFNQCFPLDDLLEKARGTKFLKDAKNLASQLKDIEKVLDPDRSINWEKSSEVLTKVKREKTPSILTMVEKLDQWQSDKSRDR